MIGGHYACSTLPDLRLRKASKDRLESGSGAYRSRCYRLLSLLASVENERVVCEI